MPSSDVSWFRVAAVAEAISWTGLLIAMVFKYLVVHNAIGVHIFGPIHGLLFLAYVAISVVMWRRQPWSRPVGLLALLSSVPPYGTVAFERWTTRTGRLVDAVPTRPLPASG